MRIGVNTDWDEDVLTCRNGYRNRTGEPVKKSSLPVRKPMTNPAPGCHLTLKKSASRMPVRLATPITGRISPIRNKKKGAPERERPWTPEGQSLRKSQAARACSPESTNGCRFADPGVATVVNRVTISRIPVLEELVLGSREESLNALTALTGLVGIGFILRT